MHCWRFLPDYAARLGVGVVRRRPGSKTRRTENRTLHRPSKNTDIAVTTLCPIRMALTSNLFSVFRRVENRLSAGPEPSDPASMLFISTRMLGMSFLYNNSTAAAGILRYFYSVEYSGRTKVSSDSVIPAKTAKVIIFTRLKSRLNNILNYLKFYTLLSIDRII